MKKTECILDFTVKLGQRMLLSGANLERVNDTMYRICESYKLEEISIFSLTSTLIVSASASGDGFCTRHISVPPTGIHLAALSRYNQLSRTVCGELPPPETLETLLKEADQREEYPTWAIIGGYLIAMTCLCLMFGGTAGDVVAADLITVALYWIIRLSNLPGLDRIVKDAICMWCAGFMALVLVRIGLGKNFFIIILTNSMMMIPGIPLVNAVRNIFCGNEMTGIIEIIKVLLETTAIVVGFVVSISMFGGLITW